MSYIPRDLEMRRKGASLGKAVLLGVCQSSPSWEGLGRIFGPGTAAEALAGQAVTQDQGSGIQSEDCSAAGMGLGSTN